VISPGHGEHYSQSARAALLQASDRGTNRAFPGANAIFRHIRPASSPLGGYRVAICCKVATDAQIHPAGVLLAPGS
jgi:hypothetical protein